MENERKDKEFERFVLDQVIRFAKTNYRVSKVYILICAACIVMGVLGLLMHKSIWRSLIMAFWAVPFWLAKDYYEHDSAACWEAAEIIEKAIDDPGFDIPDDYPEDILALRKLVCPTLKNTRSLIAAYGILSLVLWAAAVFLLFVTFADGYGGFELWMLIVSLIMAAMAVIITMLTIRSVRDLPAAKKYDRYLKDHKA